MKKILLVTVLSACLLLPACKDETTQADTKAINSNSLSESSLTESSEPEKEADDSIMADSSDSTSSDSSAETDKDSENNEDEYTDSESGNAQTAGISDNNESQADNNTDTNESDLTALAKEQFEKSAKQKWEFVINCPYELDYSSGTGTGAFLINDAGVNSVDDIVNAYCQVFAEPDDSLYSKYFESDGKVYCYDGGRGSNIYYTGTDLVLVSQSDSRLVFNAVSHYSDGEASEKTNEFSMIKKDGEWKTENFTLPY
ncbi:hypothetical protein [Porcipelethomonas sp.]|uniref:hypothetical protein n=1 Tax=Porcipelethomonas sp. TaxID=2981675 RepID=UPI003EF5B93E